MTDGELFRVPYAVAFDRLVDQWKMPLAVSMSAWPSPDGSYHPWHGCAYADSNVPVSMSLRDWVVLEESGTIQRSCDCGGWRGTTPGALLLAAADGLRVIDAASSGHVPLSWNETVCWQRKAASTATELSSWANGSARIDAFMKQVVASGTGLVDRAVVGLSHRELAEAVAAQGVQVMVRPSFGSLFESWATRRLEVISGRDDVAVRNALGSARLPLFEAELERVLAGGAVGWFMFHPDWMLPTLQMDAVVLAGAVWGSDVAGVCVVKAPLAVIDGIDAMIGHKRFGARLSVAPSVQAVELALRLWNPEPEAAPPLSFLSEAFKVASVIAA